MDTYNYSKNNALEYKLTKYNSNKNNAMEYDNYYIRI